MENSIEETKKQLELILKARKEHKEIIECAGGCCINCDPDIKALTESIDILKDYKRVLKENEYMHNELNKQETTINKYAKENEELKERIREHTLLISPYYVKKNFIPVQIIEDFIKKYQKLGDEFYEKFLETNRTDKDLHDVGLACDAKVQVLQELLEGRKNE